MQSPQVLYPNPSDNTQIIEALAGSEPTTTRRTVRRKDNAVGLESGQIKVLGKIILPNISHMTQ